MQILLRPKDRPELNDIIINERVFAIGRNESPFSSLPWKTAGALSRRHARIFEEKGEVYVADLESRNGTTLNGHGVARKPGLLSHGDEVCFGQLAYKVEVREPLRDQKIQFRAAPRLVLTPATTDRVLEPVVITEYPFLVSKSNQVFSRYGSACPEQISYLSRQHAHIFESGNNLFIKDLGSTNGTFVSGARLNGHARPLREGDVIAFGGDYFVYSIHLEQPQKNGPVAGTPGNMGTKAATDHPGTVFVSMPDSFLDIFCSEAKDVKEVEADQPDRTNSSLGDDGSEHPRWLPRWIVRLRTFVSELRQSLAEETVSNRRRVRWTAAAIVSLVTMSTLAFYLSEGTEDAMQSLLAQGRFAESVAIADELLEKDRTNKTIIELANKAMFSHLAPTWLAHLEAGEYKAANAVLRDTRELVRYNQDGDKLLDLLAWIGELEGFVDERGGTDAPFVMFNHEQRIRSLIEYWDREPKAHRRALAEIRRLAPAFKPLHTKMLSHLRALRTQESTYLPAIERLAASIKTELETPGQAQLAPIFNEFETKFPNIQGLARLRHEWQGYRDIYQQVKAKDLIKAISLLDTTPFVTPPFKDTVGTLRKTSLPDRATITVYQKVADAWRSGSTDTALRLLRDLAKQRSGDWAATQLARMENILATRDELARIKDTETYGDRLLSFYVQLDAEEDIYFVQEMRQEFETHKEKTLARSGEAYDRARQQWETYRAKGGLTGKERLAASVSTTFRSQASLLSSAYENARRAIDIYEVLALDRPQAWTTLEGSIAAELRLQRRSLEDLNMVLEPALLTKKLDLLAAL